MFVSTILFKFIFQTNAIAATGKTRTTRRERTVEMVAKATMAVVEVDLEELRVQVISLQRFEFFSGERFVTCFKQYPVPGFELTTF